MTNAFFAIENGDLFRLKDLKFTCDVDSEWADACGHDFTIMMSGRQSGESA